MSGHGADDHGKAHGHAPAPQPQVCRCGMTPWPMVMTCACMSPPAPAHDDHHDEPEKPKPKPPTFGTDVPTAVQEGLRAAWLGFESGRPPVGIIADCERVVTLMLNQLEGVTPEALYRLEKKKGCCFSFGERASSRARTADQPDLEWRLTRLVKNGHLLKSVGELANEVKFSSLKSLSLGDPLGSRTQAEAFVHLALMISEQIYAHPQWARTRQRPPQWP